MILKLLFALMLFLVLGDVVSTICIVTQVPGGQEANPLLIPLVNSLGIYTTMALSGLYRAVIITWAYSIAASGRLSNWVLLLGFILGFLPLLVVNINNWSIYLNWLALESHFIIPR